MRVRRRRRLVACSRLGARTSALATRSGSKPIATSCAITASSWSCDGALAAPVAEAVGETAAGGRGHFSNLFYKFPKQRLRLSLRGSYFSSIELV